MCWDRNLKTGAVIWNRLTMYALLVSASKYILAGLLLISVFTVCNSSVPSGEKQKSETVRVTGKKETVVIPKNDTSFSLSFRNVFTVKVILKYPKKPNGK